MNWKKTFRSIYSFKISKTTRSQQKITSLVLEHGKLTLDMLLPELKDQINREIVRVFLDRQDQNISKITELVRSKIGVYSRIIRERFIQLEAERIVQKQMKGKLYVYTLTDEVIKKWSQMLGFNIYNDQTNMVQN